MKNLFGPLPAVLLLVACAGGNGGGTTGAVSSVTPATSTATLPPASVSALQEASPHGGSPLLASGSTPNFSTSLPAIGTLFPLTDAVALLAPAGNGKGASASGYTYSPGTTLTFQGTKDVNGTVVNVFELKTGAGPLDVPNIANGSVAMPDGSHVTLTTKTLNYTLLGFWAVVPATAGDSYWGRGFTGYQTPPAGVPLSGTAHYAGGGSAPGGVFGDEFSASNTGLVNATVTGQAGFDVNFSSGAVTGSFTNMTVGVAGDGDPQPWNNVALTGSLTGSAMRGTTMTTNAPTNGLSMSSGASGTFVGALFGPNGQELGASWNLYDPSGGGKTAQGVVGAATP